MTILETDYLKQLRALRPLFQTVPAITDQIDMITSICLDLAQKRLPQHSLHPLGLEETTYLAAMVALGQQQGFRDFKTQTTTLHRLDQLLRNFRSFVAQRFGIWALLNQTFLKRWVQVFPKLNYLEIMAGNGLFSYGLTQLGQSSIATDDLSWGKSSPTARDFWLPVQSLNAIEAIKRYGGQVDAVVMIWSQDKNPIDYQVLKTFRQVMPTKYFFVIGEKFGATNSQQFWQQAHFLDSKALARLNKLYPRFDLIQDQVYLVQ
ncbi:SAM-dependent methyltransferase [Agrilactobacillus yilanensis]|uniref:SAM-dependent methyltransferase n=1 Tax=Agrilactobacillus yilanensis TaxID=2485997 RepID=A0ABW4J762_9LACO|nr:SAM-dependent methyltransferase [Agrilactobacillus yilanensis]